MRQHSVQHPADIRLECTNCRIIIRWLPTVVDGRPYCCSGCTDGGPCTCDYSRLPLTGERGAIVLHHSPTITYIADSK